jgi:hypothetical protein
MITDNPRDLSVGIYLKSLFMNVVLVVERSYSVFVISGGQVSLAETNMLFLYWLLSSKTFPDVAELIFLSVLIVLWCILMFEAVFRNHTEEVFQYWGHLFDSWNGCSSKKVLEIMPMLMEGRSANCKFMLALVFFTESVGYGFFCQCFEFTPYKRGFKCGWFSFDRPTNSFGFLFL